MSKRILSKIYKNKTTDYILNILVISGVMNIVLLDSSNSIINTKNLTSIVRYSFDDAGTSYATISVTPLGNLICSASYYQTITTKYYFGLKPDGRPLFMKDGEETEFSSSNSDRERNEGFLYGVHLSSTSPDNKEYILAIGNNNAYVELYDFSLVDPVVSKIDGKQFFNSDYNSFKYGTIFKLKNGGNIYILSLILQHTDNLKYCHVIKLYFPNKNIQRNTHIIEEWYIQSQILSYSSCFEDDNNNIICYYIDFNYQYCLIGLDYNLNPINYYPYTTFANTVYEETIFYKGIHFTGVVGAFLFFNTEDRICIQFLKYVDSNFNNYFQSSNLNPLRINNNGYSKSVRNSDFIRITDKYFCYIAIKEAGNELHLYTFKNFKNEQFIIRHYTLETDITNHFVFGLEFRLALFNDYLALATVGVIGSQTGYSYIIIFSYPNSTDFTINITDKLKSGTNPTINLYEKCKIENNIFGYESMGVQILDYPIGLTLLTEEDKTEINTSSIFTQKIELILKNEIDLSSNLRIQYVMVVKDPPFSKFKDYSEIININLCYNSQNVCDEESYYQQEFHTGRTSYCDIIVDTDQISKNCDENCIFCLKNTQECLFCKDTFWKNEDDNKKCTNITKLPTTIPKIPSTIPKIPSTIPKEPSTIPKIPTSIPKIPTTIPKVIIIDIPSTTFMEKQTVKQIENSNIVNTEENQYETCTITEIINNHCQNGRIYIHQLDGIKNNLLNDDYNCNNTIIKTQNVIIQLSKLDDQTNQDEENVSNIDLGECEDKLREENNIEDNDYFIIYKIDIKTSDLSSTFVSYEIFDSSLNHLNLDVCNDSQISIYVNANLDETLANSAKRMSDSGYNLCDENDSFYNDICSTFTSANGTDILLSDRKSDIYSNIQNTSICQTECELESYNVTNKKAKCNCDVVDNSEITTLKIDHLFNKKEIAKSFYNTLKNSNFLVMKCYKLVFDSSLFSKNYGQIILTILIIIFLVMMIIYFILGTRKIHQYLVNILKLKSKNGSNKKKRYDTEKNYIKIVKDKDQNKNKIKKGKKKRLKTYNQPPKKIKKNVKFSKENSRNYKKNKTFSKLSKSTNDLNPMKSEEIKKSKNKKKKMNDVIEQNSNKDYTSKKTFNHDEKINKKDILEMINNDTTKKNFTDTELNHLEYELAIIFDKRTFFLYYWCILKKKQLLIFTFLPMDDFNLIYVKIALFIVSFGLYITINGFFFSDDTMHKLYEDNGEFDIIYQIPQIFYSSIVSSIANILLKKLSLSENNILEFKKETETKIKKKSKKTEKCLKVKLIIFFIISLILMSFFWYFISCFCAVYRNTQIILLKDTLISFGVSMLYPFILSLIPGLFRIPALRAKNKNYECLYKISNLIYLVI